MSPKVEKWAGSPLAAVRSSQRPGACVATDAAASDGSGRRVPCLGHAGRVLTKPVGSAQPGGGDGPVFRCRVNGYIPVVGVSRSALRCERIFHTCASPPVQQGATEGGLTAPGT